MEYKLLPISGCSDMTLWDDKGSVVAVRGVVVGIIPGLNFELVDSDEFVKAVHSELYDLHNVCEKPDGSSLFQDGDTIVVPAHRLQSGLMSSQQGKRWFRDYDVPRVTFRAIDFHIVKDED